MNHQMLRATAMNQVFSAADECFVEAKKKHNITSLLTFGINSLFITILGRYHLLDLILLFLFHYERRNFSASLCHKLFCFNKHN